MNHKEYHELLHDLKYSGWLLLTQIIIAIGFVMLMVSSFDDSHKNHNKNKINKTIKNE
jgi:uncharacterized membrane protein YhaH (DUF805 family)